MLHRIIRWPLPDQLKALAEKIDSLNDNTDDTRSQLKSIPNYVDEYIHGYEHMVLIGCLERVKRQLVLNKAMEYVLRVRDRP
jgi:hypothetical protein